MGRSDQVYLPDISHYCTVCRHFHAFVFRKRNYQIYCHKGESKIGDETNSY